VVEDIVKTSPTKEESHDDKNIKNLFCHPLENNKMKCSSLIINPLVMNRSWDTMFMKNNAKKKRKEFNEVQHVENLDETSIFILSLDEVVQPFIPPT